MPVPITRSSGIALGLRPAGRKSTTHGAALRHVTAAEVARRDAGVADWALESAIFDKSPPTYWLSRLRSGEAAARWVGLLIFRGRISPDIMRPVILVGGAKEADAGHGQQQPCPWHASLSALVLVVRGWSGKSGQTRARDLTFRPNGMHAMVEKAGYGLLGPWFRRSRLSQSHFPLPLSLPLPLPCRRWCLCYYCLLEIKDMMKDIMPGRHLACPRARKCPTADHVLSLRSYTLPASLPLLAVS